MTSDLEKDHRPLPVVLRPVADELLSSWLVVSDEKGLLSDAVEQRLTALDIGRSASGHNEELAGPGGIRISKHRRSDVALPITRMLRREARCSRGADCAHRKMNCAVLQSRCETPGVFSPEDDVANGGVIWQHADDDPAVEEVGELQCRSKTEPNKGAHLVRPTDISSDRCPDAARFAAIAVPM